MDASDKKRVFKWTLFVGAVLVAIPTTAVIISGPPQFPSKEPKCRTEIDHFARERMFRTCVASAKESADQHWVKQCGEQLERMSKYSVCLRFIGDKPPPIPPVPPMRGPVGGDLYPKLDDKNG